MLVVALLILYLLVAIPFFLRHQNHTCSVLAHRIAHNWSGIDRTLRCIQYVLVLVVGVLETTASDTPGYRSLLLVAYAHQLAFAATTVSRCRKALRFWRGKLLIQSLGECLAGIDRQQPLKSAENMLVGAATVGDIVFYLTDHYSLLYVLGVVTHHDRLTLYDLVGNWAWVFSSVIMVMVGLLRIYHLLKVQQGKQGKRQMTLVMMDIVRNCVEIVMGHFFIYPHLACKTTRGVTALVAVSLGLARFDYL